MVDGCHLAVSERRSRMLTGAEAHGELRLALSADSDRAQVTQITALVALSGDTPALTDLLARTARVGSFITVGRLKPDTPPIVLRPTRLVFRRGARS